ncbi:MAG: hypothetical protein QOI04_2391 [Verrucomicrobiota bacterium]|jgi:hypothetical protein
MTTTQPVSKLVRVAALILVSAVLIVLLEMVSGFILKKFLPNHRYHPRTQIVENQFHPYLGFVHPPNARLLTSKPPAKPVFIETDAEGNSKTPLDVQNPQIRIVVTGGSSMLGTGSSSNATTVPSLIEKMINEKLGVRADVVNLGKRAYASFQEMVVLDRHLASHQADLVLSITGGLEAHHAFNFPDVEFGFLPPDVWNEAVPLQRRAERGDVIVLNWAQKLCSISNTFDLFHALASRLKKEPRALNQQIVGSRQGDTARNLSERVQLSLAHYSMMNTLARARGAEFVFFLQPAARVKARGKFSPDDAAKERTPRDQQQFLYYNAYFEAIRTANKEYIFHDITDIFPPDNAPFYYDIGHYTDRGAAIVAEAVVERIKPLIEKKLHEKSAPADASHP